MGLTTASRSIKRKMIIVGASIGATNASLERDVNLLKGAATVTHQHMVCLIVISWIRKKRRVQLRKGGTITTITHKPNNNIL